MRLQELSLIRYGKFEDRVLRFPASPQDFHFVVGPNEAGKSTLRNAIVELLFGMPNQTPLGFLHELSQLRLGATVEHAGTVLGFHRARGRAQLRTPADDKLDDGVLAALLGGTSKEFYQKMFALDHEQLVRGGRSILDASDDVGRVLFQSAAGLSSLGAVRDALRTRAEELWRPRGSCEFQSGDRALREATQDLKDSLVRTSAWVKADEARKAADDAMAAAQAGQQALSQRRARLERIRRTAPHLARLRQLEAEIDALGTVADLPASAADDLYQGQQAVAAARVHLQVAEEALARCDADRAALVADPAVIASAQDIAALAELRGACIHHPRDLPIRRREAEQLLARVFDAAQQLGWPADEDMLRAMVPGALALKSVSQQLLQHGSLAQAARSARQTLDERRRELESLQQELLVDPPAPVGEELRQALSRAQALGSSASRQLALERTVAATARQLDHALATLGNWRAPVTVLRSRPLPPMSRINALSQEEKALEAALAAAAVSAASARHEVEALTLRERQFTQVHKVVTAGEVHAARSVRDDTWRAIRDQAVPLSQGAPHLDAQLRLADELVDAQLTGATDAAELQALRHQLEVAQAAADRQATALAEHGAALERFRHRWDALAAEAGMPGMPLAEIGDWLNRLQSALALDDALQQRTDELHQERRDAQQAFDALSGALSAVMPEPVRATDLATLVSEAQAFVRQADDSRTRNEQLRQRITRANAALADATDRAAAAQRELDAWQQAWQRVLDDARLAAAASTLVRAEGALELAHQVIGGLNEVAKLRTERIEAMEADLASLRALATRLAAAIDPALGAADPFDVAQQLHARLQDARRTSDAIHQADAALRAAEHALHTRRATLSEAEARVSQIMTQCGAATFDEALVAARRADTLRRLRQDHALSQQAVAHDGDGLDRAALEAEVQAGDPASVPAQLEQLASEVEAGLARIREIAQQQTHAKQAFDAIDGQGTAATAESRRQESLAELATVADEYLENVTASRLLKWAVDRYRDLKQGPMLQRASEVFAWLTHGAFTRLSIDYEAEPPVLTARRRDDRPVEVAGLSEGTRDQLFLALRIAALEMHLSGAPALPFIADDLFINFDDGRTEAGLEVLRELSARTQVIFLTHHEHLLPLAQRVFGAALNVVRMDRTPVAA